ncbi:MAG: hypothetical protein H0T79_09215, partial [Deltaproteobacteria bacterium]|nr:hypothetical protein [Deltaproteobacteria bacterium]
VHAGEVVLYLDLALPTAPEARSIYRAVGDGRRFTIDPLDPVVTDARAPSAIIAGDLVYLYFEQAGEIRVASATDGIAFAAPVTALAGPASAPSAVVVEGEVALYHVRGDAIGLATGAPGERLVDRGVVLPPGDAQVGDPLDPTAAFWNPITQLASPHATLAGPQGPTSAGASIRLWFAGFGQESPPGSKFGQPEPIPPNYSIGFAAAEPGDPSTLAVWPYGPIADRVEVFLSHHDELGPAGVTVGGDRWFLYFVDATHTAPAGALGPFELGRLQVLGSGSR